MNPSPTYVTLCDIEYRDGTRQQVWTKVSISDEREKKIDVSIIYSMQL